MDAAEEFALWAENGRSRNQKRPADFRIKHLSRMHLLVNPGLFKRTTGPMLIGLVQNFIAFLADNVLGVKLNHFGESAIRPDDNEIFILDKHQIGNGVKSSVPLLIGPLHVSFGLNALANDAIKICQHASKIKRQ